MTEQKHIAELQNRLARLESDNAAETTWGAAVGVRYAEIKAIRKRLRALSPAPVSDAEPMHDDALQYLADTGQLHERIAALEDERDRYETALRRIVGGVVYVPQNGFAELHENEASRIARAALAETEDQTND